MAPTLVAFMLCLVAAPLRAQEIGWEANGRDVQGTRYSPAAVITRDNVARLEVAWTYRTGETEERLATAEPASFEATPLVSEGTMYVGTPLGRVIALDAATGAELWMFDPEIRRDVTYGDFASRGVSLWVNHQSPADEPCHRTIFVANAQSQLFALDAGDGRPCRAFGSGGMVDLLKGLRIAPFEPEAYTAIPRTASGAARWPTARAVPTRGRSSPRTRSAIWSSCRRAVPHRTTTVCSVSATTGTRTRSWPCAHRRVR